MPIRSREEYFGGLESDSDSDIEKEEYMIQIDGNGNIIKIPYDPFNENWFEEYFNEDWIEEYKKQEKARKQIVKLEEKKTMKNTKEYVIATNNLVEVKKLEEAEYLLKVHKNPIATVSELRKIDKKYTHEEIKKEEKRDNCKIYFGKKVE